MDKLCLHYYVSGKVQGVSYRAAAQEQAALHGITGWVCNLADGRVEVLACGDERQISCFYAWLWQGPPAAKVDSVESHIQIYQNHNNFKVKQT